MTPCDAHLSSRGQSLNKFKESAININLLACKEKGILKHFSFCE